MGCQPGSFCHHLKKALMIRCHRRHQQSPPIKNPNFHQQLILFLLMGQLSWEEGHAHKALGMSPDGPDAVNIKWYLMPFFAHTNQLNLPKMARLGNPSTLSPNNGTKIPPRVIYWVMSQKGLPFGSYEDPVRT